MKKWFAGLLVLLALVLASSTAMALVYEIWCENCQKRQDFEPTGRYICAPNEAYHLEIYRCPGCGDEQGTGYDLPHKVSKAATCISQAYCADCNKYYGDKDPDNHDYKIVYNKVDEVYHTKEEVCSRCKKINYTRTEKHTPKEAATCMSAAICASCNEAYGSPNPDAHNWSDWLPNQFNSNLHYRYCMNIGCSASESESHDGNSNCVTSATCSKCHATYKDTTKHAGPFTYTYDKYDETFHKRIETCTACGNKTGNQVSTQHEESTPADCAHAAWCNVCNQAYGDPKPDNHVWGDWIYENENQHYRICAYNESHIQHADHRGGGATCIKEGTCTDCGASYKDPNKHEGESRTAYQNVSDTEHKVMVICSSCREVTTTYNESHVEFAPANCSAWAMCGMCWTYYGAPDPNNHVGETTTTYVKTSETQHTAKIQYSDCGHTVDGASADHTETTAATCTTAAYCEVCESNYGDPDPNAHDLVQHDAQAPTCTEIGWDAYETCTRCDYSTYKEIAALGHDLVHHDAQAPNCTEVGWNAYDTCSRCALSTYTELAAWGHWYAEWTPNANATHTASCKRSCSHQRTVGCAPFTFALLTGDERTEYTLCPVCGELGDGTCLALAEAAAAEAVTRKLPAGEAVVRMGALENGQTVMSVAFEYSGVLTQPRGQVKITLPAGLLDGYALYLLSGDGTETALTLDVQEEEVSFVLDFTDAQCPVQVLRLMPVA